MKNKNRIMVLSCLILVSTFLFIVVIFPKDRSYMKYKDFKNKATSGEIISASVNSKEILFNLKSELR